MYDGMTSLTCHVVSDIPLLLGPALMFIWIYFTYCCCLLFHHPFQIVYFL